MKLICLLRALLRLAPIHKDRRLRKPEREPELIPPDKYRICDRCLRIRSTRKRVKA